MELENGFTLEVTKDISYNDYYNLFEDIKDKFKEYKISLPKIHGGFILDDKFIKIFINEFGNIYSHRSNKLYTKEEWIKIERDIWPNNIILEKWKDNKTKLISKGRKIGTLLISKWNKKELEIIEKCLQKIGLKRIGKFPNLL